MRSFLDRVCVVEIKSEDVRETIWPAWKDWAEGLNNPHEIHPQIVTYNTWKEGESIYKFDAYSEEKSPTFRSWTKLSGFLEQGTSAESLRVLGPGCIGTATWADFNGYMKLGENMPSLPEIEGNPETAKVPNTDDCPSATYAVICNIATGLKARRKRKE